MRRLSVISSNIRYDEPDDEFRWKTRREILAAALLEEQPDIVATQEGKRPQLDDMARQLAGLQCVDSHRDWLDTLMYPCIFYNSTTLTLRESGDVWLSKTPAVVGSSSFGSLFPRLCTWARFAEGLLVFNVHLDNSSSETRASQTNVLLDQIELIRSESESILLLGDFNEAPQGLVREVIAERDTGFSDPWQLLQQDEEASHHNFGEPIDYGSRIDWILVAGELRAKSIYLDKRRSDSGVYPSDHYPLKAEFEFDLG